MRKTILKALKGPAVTRAMRDRKELYQNIRSRENIAEYQTRKFNEVWANALKVSPFYRDWAKQYSLPSHIIDIRETNNFPVLRKRDLVDFNQELLNFRPDSFYVSGGSTGEPTKFPRKEYESTLRYANTMLAHSWLDLHPGDRYVHLWGHAHLFGQGKRAVLRKKIRKAKDWLVGGYRLNAYNQSSSDIQKWIEAVKRVNPKYMVGYSSALVNLASEIEDSLGVLYLDNLKWIICTAESITPNDRDLLSRVFGVPVAIEYGANETGIIAHSRPLATERLQLLWGSLAGTVDEDNNLRLTTLDPRAFPLINYDIGDRVENVDQADHALSFQSVLGRSNEQISLRLIDDSLGKISMVGVVGALKNVNGIRTVQAAQLAKGRAEIYLTGPYEVEERKIRKLFLHELGLTGVHIHPEALSFRHLENPVKSLAGKTNLIVPKLPR